MYNTPSWEEYTQMSQEKASNKTIHIDMDKVITDDFCAKHDVSMEYDSLGGFGLYYKVDEIKVFVASYVDCTNEPIRIASSFKLNTYHNKYHKLRHTFDIKEIYKRPTEFVMNSENKPVKQYKWKNDLNFYTNSDNLTNDEFRDELGRRIDWSISVLKKKIPILKEKHEWLYKNYIDNIKDVDCISELSYNDLMKSETGVLRNKNTYKTYILNLYEDTKSSRWIMMIKNNKTAEENIWIVNCKNGNCSAYETDKFSKEDIESFKLILENM